MKCRMLRCDPKKKVYFLSSCDRVNPSQRREEEWTFTIIISLERGKWSTF